MRKIILPNDANGFLVDELRERLRDGHTVRIAFGGGSMLPLIDGEGDIVHLAPLDRDQALIVGEVYLFIHEGSCVVHRLVRMRNGQAVFRGDNCMREETADRSAVLARLVAVEHRDGTVEQCDEARWRRRSRRIVERRAVVNWAKAHLGRRQRRWLRWVYFACLAVLMWAPLGGLGVPLDNFVLGIRMDHLLHASVYIPCVFFLMDFGTFRGRFCWLVAILIAATTETVQYLLPYRGFDINDLVANFLGVTLGWLLLRVVGLNRRKT